MAAAKAKLRAAVISDEMRKSILSDRISHLFPTCTLSSGVWRRWGSTTTARKECRSPWCEGKLKVLIMNSAICILFASSGMCIMGNRTRGSCTGPSHLNAFLQSQQGKATE